MRLTRKLTLAGCCLLAALACGLSARAEELTIGVVQPLTGPASGLGIPIKNAVALWPKTLAGVPVKVVTLDDATDPTTGMRATQRLVTDQNVDVLIGSTATPVTIPMADVAAGSGTPHLATAPAILPAGKDKWMFRLAQSNSVMAHAMIKHMQKANVKTVGFLGYTDAYGEQWLSEFRENAERVGIKVTTVERFARADTSVTAQVLKLVSSKPDAILIVASGSGAGMPQKTVVERGYKSKVYQTHAAATRDLMRTAGKEAEGAFVVSGPAIVGNLLPESHPSKAISTQFVTEYEAAYGPKTATNFAANGFDAWQVLEKAVPVALKKAKPGTPEFRSALRDAIETMGRTVIAGGVVQWGPDDHWGFTDETGVMLKVVNGEFQVEP